jgi:hypothetical protein
MRKTIRGKRDHRSIGKDGKSMNRKFKARTPDYEAHWVVMELLPFAILGILGCLAIVAGLVFVVLVIAGVV